MKEQPRLNNLPLPVTEQYVWDPDPENDWYPAPGAPEDAEALCLRNAPVVVTSVGMPVEPVEAAKPE